MATSGRGTGQSPANVTRFLKGIDFPAQKKDLIQQARKNQADQAAMKLIQNMEEREYDSMADVVNVYGQEPQSGRKQEQQSKSTSQTKGKSGHAQHR